MYGDRKQDWGRGDRREEDVHTISVKAGKRTYFFDIRATRPRTSTSPSPRASGRRTPAVK